MVADAVIACRCGRGGGGGCVHCPRHTQPQADTHVENVGDAHSLQQLAARGHVVAAKVQEALQNRRGHYGRRCRGGLAAVLQAVSAHAARLSPFVLPRTQRVRVSHPRCTLRHSSCRRPGAAFSQMPAAGLLQLGMQSRAPVQLQQGRSAQPLQTDNVLMPLGVAAQHGRSASQTARVDSWGWSMSDPHHGSGRRGRTLLLSPVSISCRLRAER